MRKPEVSIIITIHNSEKYIRECLSSACNQVFKQVEILCIDGGSTDLTPKILVDIQKTDDRIRIINDINTSYGHKVNRGIQEARGKYIAILESDDCYYEDMIGVLYTKAEETGADFVDGDLFRCFTYDGKWLGVHEDKYPKKEYYGKVIEKNWLDDVIFCPGAIYTGLYRKDFLVENNISLHESQGASYQDVGFAFLTHALAKRTFHINKPVYMYRNDNAGSSIYNCKKVFEIVKEFEFIRDQFEQRGIEFQLLWKQFFITKYGCYLDRLNYMYHEGRELFITAMVEELSRDIKDNKVTLDELIEYYGDEIIGLYPDRDKMLSFYEHRMINTLPDRVSNILDALGNQPCVVCGAGKRGREILHYLIQNGNVVDGICDNADGFQNKLIEGVSISKFEELTKLYKNDKYIIANKKNNEVIRHQLITLGIENEQIMMY